MTSPIVFDRSRVEAYEKCPRLRYLAYEAEGRGFEPVKRFLALEAGGAIHVGLQALLTSIAVAEAVELALLEYDHYVNASGVDMTLYEGQEPQRVVDEHKAIVEALLRAFATVELQSFLSDYVVVAVEQEVYEDFEVAGRRLRLLARLDVVVRRRSDGTLFVLNFKTASALERKWRDTMTHSMQTISEVIAAEQHYGPMGGVLIYGLAKGKRSEYPQGSGNWYHNSPLLWAWRRGNTTPVGPEYDWAHRYAWTDETGSHRLGKGYTKVSVWDNYPGGVAAWVAHLAAVDPAMLREQFVLLPPIMRQPADVEEWRESVLTKELLIADDARMVQTEANGITQKAMNVMFPRHTAGGNCVWPSRCSMYEICWGSAGADPIGSRLYQLRNANHPAEMELRQWNSEVIE
jgi:hypothetical protein